MIEIQCPACQKIQPEAELMIDAALKQRCFYCGVMFEMNVTKDAVQGTDRLSGKIVSKGLLDHASEDTLAFKVEPKARTLFAVLLFLVGAVILFTLRDHRTMSIAAMSLSSLAAGIAAGMLAGQMGYSEILTAGGSGFLAGFALALIGAFETGGDFTAQLQVAAPIFGIFSVCSFLGGTAAWILRKYFDVKLKDAEK